MAIDIQNLQMYYQEDRVLISIMQLCDANSGE